MVPDKAKTTFVFKGFMFSQKFHRGCFCLPIQLTQMVKRVLQLAFGGWIVINFESFSQKLTKSLTLASASGGTSQVTTGNHQILLQHAVGQPIHYSTSEAGNLTLRQGFIQPPGSGNRVFQQNSSLRAAIFPNPTTGQISIRFDEILESGVKLKLFTILGKEVFEKDLNPIAFQNVQLPILPNGPYLLLLTCKNRSYHTKLIIFN